MDSSLSASNFLEFFDHKIESIRKYIDASLTAHPGAAPRIHPEATFQQFSTILLDELDKLTWASK